MTEWRGPVERRIIAGHRRATRRWGARRAIAGALAAGAVAAVASTWASTAIYDAVAGRDGIAALDRPALHAAKRLRSPLIDRVAAAIAVLFGPIGMPVVTGSAAFGLSRLTRSSAPLILMSSAAVGSLAMTIGGKRVVARHRPPRRDAVAPFETSPSFPSGHSLNATVLVGVAAYLVMLRQRSPGAQVATAAAAVATVVAVGASRILIGAHWLTDVLVAYGLGGGWLATVITVDRIRLTEQRGSGTRGGVEIPPE